MKRGLKKLEKSQKKLEKRKKSSEQQFVQNWSPHERNREYDALEDPHAKYYFFNKCMNQHLKGLKKALKREPNETEKTKLTVKIDNRLNTKLPSIKNATPKTVIYMNEISRSEKQMKSHDRKGSILSNSSSRRLQRQSGSKIRKQSRDIIMGQDKSITEVSREFSKTALEKQKAPNLDEVHSASHQKFLNFLAKKKQFLRYPTQTPKNELNQTEKQPERQWKQEQKMQKEQPQKK